MSNKNVIDNIKNYGAEIESLKDFITAVKKMPGMYIGHRGNKGFINMIREVFQNSIDEMMKPSSPCSRVSISYDERTKVCTISDNGRGVPFDRIEDVYTREHTSSNYKKKKYEYSSGTHGVGAKVTNALSEWFIVESYIDVPGMRDARRAEFKEGYLTNKGVYQIKNPGKQGTIISFKVSEKHMNKITITYHDVYQLAKGILYLCNEGDIVDFTGIDLNGKVYTESIVNTRGIAGILDMFIKEPISPIIRCFADTGELKADIRFTFDMKADPVIIGYSNFCPTSAGDHMDGALDGVIKFFKDYMNKIYLKDSNKKKKTPITITTQDIKSSLILITSAAVLIPTFSGQHKDELSDPAMRIFSRDLVISTLDAWSRGNNSDFMKICKHIKSLAEIRINSETEKVKLADSYKSSTLSKGLPAKYIPPNGNKNLELIICEGDSAAGSAKNSRCHLRQGIFPIRGKVKNAMQHKRKEILSNEEAAGILAIIGAGCGTKNFDINKVKWDKVIFGTDADVDGAHISCLLLNLFLIFCPELIEAGKVYRAVPPLYGIRKGKNMQYIVDDKDLIAYVQKSFIKENTILNMDKSNLSNKAISDILYKNLYYVDEVDRIAKAHSIAPELLELICYLLAEYGYENIDKKHLKKINQAITNRFRFVQSDIVDGILHVTGLVGNYTNTIYFDMNMLMACTNIFLAIDESPKYFILNNEMVSLYDLMIRYKNYMPKSLIRYKGLGEMNASQLAESTFHPDSNRTLIRYTISSAMDEVQKIKYYEDNKKELIANVEVSKHDLV
jgi:DNA gyrase subunit B